jgi:Na+:H+ antiporter, NhaC family
MQYLPYAFFNLVNPLVALAYAFTGFRIERIEPAETPTTAAASDALSVHDQRGLTPGGDRDVE